ncbi:3'-5' exonuclease [Pseudoalteromonas sp. NZS100]|uniref:3'-5' exonuclease n=1 Tax=Pseudoalteromonas sp. NZS100 TaxID=2792046 RepID=UPI0018CEB00C|nr:3'-5' exonuclease [Pseudoalteromonas sp. NZS100]MBH0066763.1 3'-5' exoribonuclease [Pseudoalteromonas sp. NZS100]
MKDVMTDVESMGTGSNAALVSIGACFFDPMTGDIGAGFEVSIDLTSSATLCEMDADTVLWWLKQDDEARQKLLAHDVLPLAEALGEFDQWVSQIEDIDTRNIWGNGATFDNTIIRNAYKACDMQAPWQFRNDRDVRTIVDLGRRLFNFDPKTDMPFEGTRHNALDDAIHQAKYVSAIFQKLQAGGSNG